MVKIVTICVDQETLFQTFTLKIFIKSFKVVENMHTDMQ